LGVSAVTNKDVFATYLQRIPTTLKLAIAGTIIGLLIAIPLGITAAVHQNTWRDSSSTVLGLLGLSMPNFWLGLLLIIAFSLHLNWFPSMYDGTLRGLILPAITLGTGHAALTMRTTRSSMLEVVRQDYLRTVRAKGVSEKVVINKHALKNALIPIITVIGTQVGHAMGGAVLTETVFACNGVGRLIVDSVNYRDTEMVCGAIILTTFLSSFIMLIIDLIYAFIDPSIKARYTR
ncbi:MAG TPA: ABC transporter permease, partial [Bacillota bacterium]|nr:ABC transporter permease [Bacillota bacterium]